MALNANALVTLDKAKIYVGIPLAETSLDTLVEDFINESSELVEMYCNRRFTSTAHVGTRDGNRTNELLLHQWPITALTEVRIDPRRVFGSETIIALAEFQLFHNERFEDIGIRRVEGQIFPRGAGTIQVSYTAGYTAFLSPSDIQLATKMAVGYYFNKQQNKEFAISTKSKGDEDVSIISGIPEDATKILDAHTRLDLAGEGYPLVNK